MPRTNDAKLDRGEQPAPRSSLWVTWTTREGVQVTVERTEDARVDASEPWIASCDTHSEMIACSTKAAAMSSARRRDWCSGCTKQ